MTPEPNFEDMSFKPFTVNEHSTIDPELDPDTNFFESISSLDTKYFTVNETKTFVSNIDSESFTVLHLNIRSMKKNFESFQEFFKDLKFNFSAICLSETWCESVDATKNSNYKLNGYRSFHQIRNERKGGRLCIFLRESYTYKLRSDLNINSDAIECLCIEILNKHSKNLILNLSYRPPQGDTILFEKNLQDLLLKNDICKKDILMTGDLNINLLDYENNKKVQSFVNLMFHCGMVPAINKPTRVMRYTATAIDHIFTNSIINTETKSDTIKTDISDHFPILFVPKVNVDVSIRTEQYILKRNICAQSIKKFKQKLRDVI